MAKNLIPEIAKMLGVEMGEEFKVNLNGWNNTYRFNNNGLYGRTQTEKWIACPELFCLLTTGNAEIVKLPWKPKKDEYYWTFKQSFKDGKLFVLNYTWDDSVIDDTFLKAGLIYRTKAEAEAALPKMAAKFGMEYKL